MPSARLMDALHTNETTLERKRHVAFNRGQGGKKRNKTLIYRKLKGWRRPSYSSTVLFQGWEFTQARMMTLRC